MPRLLCGAATQRINRQVAPLGIAPGGKEGAVRRGGLPTPLGREEGEEAEVNPRLTRRVAPLGNAPGREEAVGHGGLPTPLGREEKEEEEEEEEEEECPVGDLRCVVAPLVRCCH